MILSGAGASTMARYEQLAARLASAGASVCTFDYFGHGESDGLLSEQSLERRFQQAEDMLTECFDPSRDVTLVSFSMSGQTAADLFAAGRWRIQNLILCSPAAYSKDAWRLPFEAGFTAEIRRPDSWRSSSAFTSLARYSGLSAIITAEHENVIPEGVADMYLEALRCCGDPIDWTVLGADHRLGSWFAQHGEDLERLVELILRSEKPDIDREILWSSAQPDTQS